MLMVLSPSRKPWWNETVMPSFETRTAHRLLDRTDDLAVELRLGIRQIGGLLSGPPNSSWPARTGQSGEPGINNGLHDESPPLPIAHTGRIGPLDDAARMGPMIGASIICRSATPRQAPWFARLGRGDDAAGVSTSSSVGA